MSIAVARCALLCVLGACSAAVARAQGPALAQLSHRAWTVRDGAPRTVYALAQTPDGFLWLGTEAGLYRFDGVRFEAFEPPDGRALPSRSVSALLALADGALWIGYSTGGASVLAHGRVTSYGMEEGLPPRTVTALARDSAGGLWAATTGGLAQLVGGRWRLVGAERGYPGGTTADLLVDRRGTLWAAERSGVYVLARGARRFVWRAPSLDADPGGAGMPREAPDGSVWGTSLSRGLVRLSDSTGGPPPAAVAGRPDADFGGLLIDRGGNGWLFAGVGRLVRVPLRAASGASGPGEGAARQTLVLSRATGTSGSMVNTMLEDREGTVWAGTEGGLDQFRAPKLTPVAWPRPVLLPALAAGDDDAVWAGSVSGPLVALGDGVVAHPQVPAGITCAHRDLDGGVWLGGPPGVWHARGGPFARVALPEQAVGKDVQAIARGRDGTLWLAVRGEPPFRRRGGEWERFAVPRGVGERNVLTITADGAGRTWLGYAHERLARVAADSVRVFSAADGLHVGNVTAVHVRGDRVWVGGERGVVVLDDAAPGARFQPFAVVGGALRGISGIVETGDGELWLNGTDGVTRVPAAEARRAREDAGYRARTERYDFRDGVHGAAPQIRPLPTAIQGTDGRLWFGTESGVSWVDPARLRRNALAPPVHVRALEAGGVRHAATRTAAGDRVTLPPRTTAVQISYTALSLAVPERVRFRYQLVGSDSGWQEAGTRREAFYTNLAPGAYRFRVVAANDDGVWNEAGATLDVVIPPTFVQSHAFLVLCAAAGGGVVWLLVQWRHRQVARALRAQFAAALAERTRVARELHDTLLSDVAGLTMRLDAAATRAAAVGAAAGVAGAGADGAGDGEVVRLAALLGELRDQARRTLDDVRGAVVAMRTGADLVPLWERLAEAARRTFASTGVEVRVAHTGEPRTYAPEVEGEVLRIVAEAMTNARAHAGCRTVVVRCAYERGGLRIEVRDDGRGFDPAHAERARHYGLAGMRERAAAIGAQLTITSAPGRGTELLLLVPATGRVRPIGAER